MSTTDTRTGAPTSSKGDTTKPCIAARSRLEPVLENVDSGSPHGLRREVQFNVLGDDKGSVDLQALRDHLLDFVNKEEHTAGLTASITATKYEDAARRWRETVKSSVESFIAKEHKEGHWEASAVDMTRFGEIRRHPGADQPGTYRLSTEVRTKPYISAFSRLEHSTRETFSGRHPGWHTEVQFKVDGDVDGSIDLQALENHHSAFLRRRRASHAFELCDLFTANKDKEAGQRWTQIVESSIQSFIRAKGKEKDWDAFVSLELAPRSQQSII